MTQELKDWIRKSLKQQAKSCDNSANLVKLHESGGISGGIAQLLRHRVHQYPNDQDETLWLDMADKSCFIAVRIAQDVWNKDPR